MKIKLSANSLILGLIIGAVITFMISASVGTLHSWSSGDILTASDLNNNFDEVRTAIESIPEINTQSIRYVTYSTSLTETDQVVVVNTAGNSTATLPAASDDTIGKVFYIYNLINTGYLTIEAAGSDAIFGKTVNDTANEQGGCFKIIGFTNNSWIVTYSY